MVGSLSAGTVSHLPWATNHRPPQSPRLRRAFGWQIDVQQAPARPAHPRAEHHEGTASLITARRHKERRQSRELGADAEGRSGASLRCAVELVQDTRLRLALNVSEELALEAVSYRVEAIEPRLGSRP